MSFIAKISWGNQFRQIYSPAETVIILSTDTIQNKSLQRKSLQRNLNPEQNRLDLQSRNTLFKDIPAAYQQIPSHPI